ncbi:Transcriptional regulator, contains XRE-family HTH domain [Roseivivax halotolerans]|uniref:Transcriptional regulator, contains XRE-family HTH domain n=1 Tax=Roseivivax halotolerans TaxID=93684 RepID=A0A1I5XXD7_9RHOB|nr:helix-turn-helix transcriptional regulator [Roseivivax halotolerans]SFQ36613.1 Transcriptional regulator, contains XRE-family HTH domain [Roseivivax halotolerans]
MVTKVDKRARAELFRQRLREAMQVAGVNLSELARQTGVNRSTVSQLMGEGAARLPNAQLAAEAARTLGVSTDWLLGLTDRPERPGDVVAAAMQMTTAERTPSDEQLIDWAREAAGYKIRHVPAMLPDMLKTEAVMRWEYGDFLGKTPDQAISAMRDRMALVRAGGSDYEIAMPIYELTSMARGEGYYRSLPRAARAEQVEQLAATCEELYPSLRLFLFDASRVFSAPITIFGPLVGVVYVGRFYIAFRESGRIRSLTEHFDWLVREAEIDARDAAGFLRDLARDVL